MSHFDKVTIAVPFMDPHYYGSDYKKSDLLRCDPLQKTQDSMNCITVSIHEVYVLLVRQSSQKGRFLSSECDVNKSFK